jgi:hypothetical protein
MYTYIYIYIFIYLFIYSSTNACLPVNTYTSMHVSVHVFMCVHVHICMYKPRIGQGHQQTMCCTYREHFENAREDLNLEQRQTLKLITLQHTNGRNNKPLFGRKSM